MVWLWWVIGAILYLLMGAFTFGVLQMLQDEPLDYDGVGSLLSTFGAMVWPLVLFVTLVIGLVCVVSLTLYLVAEATRLTKLVRRVAEWGHGGR